VNEAVRPGETIMGMQTYWLGLYDHPYLRWEYLFLYPRLYPGKTMADAFEKYRPDIFIVDREMQMRLSDTADPNVDLAYYYYHLPRTDFFRYLNDHATLIASFENDVYGPVQVYRFEWPGQTGLSPGMESIHSQVSSSGQAFTVWEPRNTW
jgi:hypothetical protein